MFIVKNCGGTAVAGLGTAVPSLIAWGSSYICTQPEYLSTDTRLKFVGWEYSTFVILSFLATFRNLTPWRHAWPRDYPRTQICKIGVKASPSTPTTLSVEILEIASWHVSRFQCYHVIPLSMWEEKQTWQYALSLASVSSVAWVPRWDR